MILGDPDVPPHQTAGTTLDDLFHLAVETHPDALALCDPANRDSIDGVGPRRLTWAQADRAITAVAGRMRRLGLGADTVVAMQLPNTVESIVTLLGVIRAGMIAAPLPMLWRRQDCVTALSAVGARAIVTTARVGGSAYGEIAMGIAADVFAIRYVCCYGSGAPDGTIPLDDLLAADALLESAPFERPGNPASHVAILTFHTAPDLAPHRTVALGRSHAALIAGGKALVHEARLQPGESILACCSANSLAGLTAGLLAWLLTGGTLTLHHPFDAGAFADACGQASTAVVPGSLTSRLEQAGLLVPSGLRRVVALWRAPERLALADPWNHPGVRLTDALAFGETATICIARGPNGRPPGIPHGPLAPRRDAQPATIAETAVTDVGTLAIRGDMIPAGPFPPNARVQPSGFGADGNGFADTGYPCRLDRDRSRIVVTGPPPGLVSVGGYRFRQEDLQSIAASLGDAVLTALPDALAGHRLAGQSADREAIRQALAARGYNPLIAGAFTVRRRSDAA
jgi:acyl-CoA synthetase (AMP-forming)/AMP-acid ligase II